MSEAVLGLGSNLGDRLAALQGCLDLLVACGATLDAVSGVVETDPVGGPEQDDFLNAVVLAHADGWSPRRWLTLAHECEATARRRRGVRWGPRTLDVDVLAVRESGEPVTSDDPVLTLPHPRAFERAFVLVPWAQADPSDGGVAAALTALGDTGAAVRPRPDLPLRLP